MLKDNGAKRWYWLITKHLVSRMDVLTICLGDDGEALAIFSFEEEAQMYLHCHPRASEEEWRARQTSVGELVSVLYGPCSDTKKVVLDPLPRIGKKELVGLLRMHRSAFLRFLLRQEAPSHLHFVPSRSHGPRKVVSHAHVA